MRRNQLAGEVEQSWTKSRFYFEIKPCSPWAERPRSSIECGTHGCIKAVNSQINQAQSAPVRRVGCTLPFFPHERNCGRPIATSQNRQSRLMHPNKLRARVPSLVHPCGLVQVDGHRPQALEFASHSQND